jgi:hypothetical protein
MRRFIVPKDIQLIDPINDKPVFQPVKFRDFALQLWLNDKRIGASQVALARLGATILPKFVKAKPGDMIELEDADYEVLLPIVREPGDVAYGPLLGHQLLPFANAFIEAETIKEKEGSNGVQPRGARSAPAHHANKA